LYFKLAYFELCRYYFFGVLLLSFTLPLIPSILGEGFINTIPNKLFNLNSSGDKHNISYINVEDSFLYGKENLLSKIPFVKIAFIVWVSGFIRYLFIITKNILSVLKIINRGEKRSFGDYIIVKSNAQNNAFTFFRFIFTNQEFYILPEKEQEQILKHEKLHAKQLHTIDNVLFELMRAVLWFNPISKLISANIKIIHEFIVDNKLTGNKNIPDYSRLILKMAVHNSHALTVSSFSNDEIKNRIKLISFPESEKIRKARFNASVPVLLITIFAAYLIISTVNIYAKDKPDELTLFRKPFNPGTYKIISPFFENKTPSEVYTGYDRNIDINEQYKISHRETAYEVKSFTEVYAIETGIVSHIKEEDVFGLKEMNIEILLNSGHRVIYKSLFKITGEEKDSVQRGEIIGLSGDVRLFPAVRIKLFENNIAVDPEIYY